MAEPAVVVAAAPEAYHITNRLTIAGKQVSAFGHSYWTEAQPTAKLCSTPAGRVRCSCGLFTLVWTR